MKFQGKDFLRRDTLLNQSFPVKTKICEVHTKAKGAQELFSCACNATLLHCRHMMKKAQCRHG